MAMPNQRSDETGKIWDFYGSLGKQADRWRWPETLCFMRIISTHVLQVSHTLPHVRVVGQSGTSAFGAWNTASGPSGYKALRLPTRWPNQFAASIRQFVIELCRIAYLVGQRLLSAATWSDPLP